jgi:hypothetical protein
MRCNSERIERYKPQPCITDPVYAVDATQKELKAGRFFLFPVPCSRPPDATQKELKVDYDSLKTAFPPARCNSERIERVKWGDSLFVAPNNAMQLRKN